MNILLMKSFKLSTLELEVFINVCLFLILFSAADLAFSGDSKTYDRTSWFDVESYTSDDLRRVPMPKNHADHDGIIVLVGGRLFDGTGRPAYPATIVTKGKLISQILKPGDVSYPQHAEILNINGKTVMPGLIDLHVHTTYVNQFGLPHELSSDSQADAALRGVERLGYYLKSGITTIRDVGSHGLAPFLLKQYVDSGAISGPRIYAAGQIIVGKGGHGTEGFTLKTSPVYKHAAVREASGADDWRDAVRTQFKNGANLIKLASHYAPLEIEAAVDEAHRLGLRVTVDAETQFIDMAIDAGVDSIEHPMPRSDVAIQRMKKNGIAAIPTIWILNQVIDWGGGGYWGSTSRRFTTSKERSMSMLQKLKNADIKMGIGTDLVLTLYKELPAPYIGELKNFQAVGYSTSETLIMATRVNAEILGMDDKLGTLEVGKLADIIVINGQPDQHVDDLEKVETVIVNGKVLVRKSR